jgi:hypothetical protein
MAGISVSDFILTCSSRLTQTLEISSNLAMIKHPPHEPAELPCRDLHHKLESLQSLSN